jgi:mycofactocin system FadH/OYE family oxidoreductase 1
MRNRIVFGPHETNLGQGRSISKGHVAYYSERARGGTGLVVIEEASVHDSDWPYERAPLASQCPEGWAKVAAGCHEHGALVVAGLGHSGGQGSSAYSQDALWAPSAVPDVATREVPKAMEEEEIEALVAGFGSAATAAVASGLDGVEVNAGQWSLLRQFLSPLTNHRGDRYGTERTRLVSEVLHAVREAVGDEILGLRISLDELAPWAGIVPEAGAALLVELCAVAEGRRQLVDYVTIVRGSAYGTGATRPDGNSPAGFGRSLAEHARRVLAIEVAVFAQGSIVDIEMADDIVSQGQADAVEMTRAQIADPWLSRKAATGSGGLASIRPCVLCNQQCQVRDVRNPIVSCVTEPRSGHELTDPDPVGLGKQGALRATGEADRARLLVVGGGPAGLECARVAALGGLSVRLVEREANLGGMVTAAVCRMPGHERFSNIVSFLVAECERAGVEMVTGHEVTIEEIDGSDCSAVFCTGSRPGRRTYEVVPPVTVLTAAEVLAAEHSEGLPETVVVWDPIGGPIGVAVALVLAGLAGSVALVTPDFVAGEQLARTGDLAPGNVRLARAGVEIVKHCVVSSVGMDAVVVEDRFGGGQRSFAGAICVDAGHRLPEDTLYGSTAGMEPGDRSLLVAGDAVAPRTVHEAVLEGRRAAFEVVRAASLTSVP